MIVELSSGWATNPQSHLHNYKRHNMACDFSDPTSISFIQEEVIDLGLQDSDGS